MCSIYHALSLCTVDSDVVIMLHVARVCVCVCVCEWVRERVCVCVSECVCVRARVSASG